MNQVNLIGRTTRDIELKNTPSGKSVASFSLAVDRGFKDKDGNKQTDFLDIVAWNKTAETLAKYVSKGQLIGITGSIQTRNYDDKEGKKRKVIEILASNFYFCENKKNNTSIESDSPSYSSTVETDFSIMNDDDDLPFN